MTGFRFTKQPFTLLTGLIVLGFAVVVYQGAAEEQPSTLSGRVINAKGEPIAKVPIALLYVKVGENGEIDTLDNRARYPFLRQIPARHLPPEFRDETPEETRMRPPFLKSETDSEGQFTFTGIATEMVQLMILPLENDPVSPRSIPQNITPAPEIQTVKFGKVAFHPHESSYFPPLGAVTFAIKPGTNTENVEVKVLMEGPPKIQGRLVFKNGEPLVDTTVEINIGRLNLDWGAGSTFSRSLHTDADGNFVSAVYPLGAYALSVNHRGLSAVSEPFTVKAGELHEKVVLTLNGNSADLSDPPPKNPEEQRHGLPNVPGMWVANPANGHAYKWIACDDWEDAQTQAADEGAHLVTITSEAEQIWLEAVFGEGPYWIGLTDVLKEGEWLWETGEPVTYTNWKEDENEDLLLLGEPPALLKAFGVKGDRQRREDERDYAIMSSHWDEEIGKWRMADVKGAAPHGRTQMAILEKDGMRSKIHGLSLPDATPKDK